MHNIVPFPFEALDALYRNERTRRSSNRRFDFAKSYPDGFARGSSPASGTISELVSGVGRAQELARRSIAVSLFELEIALAKCRSALLKLPDQMSPGKEKLENDLRTLECTLIKAQAAIRCL